MLTERQLKLLINLLRTLPFLLLFGLFGDKEIGLFSITRTLIQTWPSLSFRKPQNFSCANRLRQNPRMTIKMGKAVSGMDDAQHK